MTDLPQLYQFRYSMYPEKARWALDYAGIPHIRRALLPGLHPPTLLKLAKQKCVPVLKLGSDTLITESSDIMEWASSQNPEANLYPEEYKGLIQELVAHYDEIGTHARRAYFYHLIQCNDFAADLMSYGHSEKTQRCYRRFFPVVKKIMQLDMRITQKAAAKSEAQLKEALDQLAKRINEHGFQAGEQFSAADLTAATVFSVCCLPDQYPVPVPKPRPAPIEAWTAKWQNHPAIAWVNSIYAKHRPASSAVRDVGLKDN